jgi:hypothetical protein
VKEKPDAKALYANKTPGSKPYNYIFRKVLIRKIGDVSLSCYSISCLQLGAHVIGRLKFEAYLQEHAPYLKELKERGDVDCRM